MLWITLIHFFQAIYQSRLLIYLYHMFMIYKDGNHNWCICIKHITKDSRFGYHLLICQQFQVFDTIVIVWYIKSVNQSIVSVRVQWKKRIER